MATQTDPELHSKPEGFKSLSEAPSKRMAYMVHGIKQSVSINLAPHKELGFGDLADGCIGVSLWFDSYSKAVAYADGREISQAEVEQ